jgi:hypothetical protein
MLGEVAAAADWYRRAARYWKRGLGYPLFYADLVVEHQLAGHYRIAPRMPPARGSVLALEAPALPVLAQPEELVVAVSLGLETALAGEVSEPPTGGAEPGPRGRRPTGLTCWRFEPLPPGVAAGPAET